MFAVTHGGKTGLHGGSMCALAWKAPTDYAEFSATPKCKYG